MTLTWKCTTCGTKNSLKDIILKGKSVECVHCGAVNMAKGLFFRKATTRRAAVAQKPFSVQM